MDSVLQRYKRKKSGDDDNVDFISQLPDDVLLLILQRLSTREAIFMSLASKRWEHVWKKLPHLVLVTRTSINSTMLRLSDDSNPDAVLTRVINNHDGDLESCVILHFSHEGVHGLLNTWIHSLIWIKHTKNLKLYHGNIYQQPTLLSSCSFPRCSLSHPSLMSLSLNSYHLTSSRPFRNCSNIKTLKLFSVFAPEIGVFNNILAFCPSLEVLVLNVNCTDTRRKRLKTLRIENSKLKFLEICYITGIDKVLVSAPNLDILVAKDIFSEGREFLLQSPNLQFNGNSMIGDTTWLQMIYNISKEKNSGHEELVNRMGEFDFLREECATLSVAVDLMNQTEVERLRQVLCLWSNLDDSRGMEIKFKGNNSPSPSSSEEELEGWQKKLWVDKDSFPNAKFRANFVLTYNFKGSKEEIAFVSCLIRQGKVERRILINSNSFSASNMSNIEAAVAKLREVQSENQEKEEDQQKVTIEYFRD